MTGYYCDLNSCRSNFEYYFSILGCYSVSDFSKLCGLSRATIHSYLNGKYIPSLKNAFLVVNLMNEARRYADPEYYDDLAWSVDEVFNAFG